MSVDPGCSSPSPVDRAGLTFVSRAIRVFLLRVTSQCSGASLGYAHYVPGTLHATLWLAYCVTDSNPVTYSNRRTPKTQGARVACVSWAREERYSHVVSDQLGASAAAVVDICHSLPPAHFPRPCPFLLTQRVRLAGPALQSGVASWIVVRPCLCPAR